MPDALVTEVAQLHRERAAIKASEYAPDKESRLLRELDERWSTDLEKFLESEQQRAAAERDKELISVAAAERLAAAPPTKRPTETGDEFLGRALAALNLRQQHGDHLRHTALDVDYASLGTGGWIRDHHHLLITGPTGIGKSWLASAFVESACRHGFTATYVRAPRLLHDLAVSRGDGSYGRLLAKLAKLDLLAIDDWLLAPLTDADAGISSRSWKTGANGPRR